MRLVEKFFISFIFFSLSFFSCAKEDTKIKNSYSISQFMSTESLAGLSLSHDGKNIIYTSNKSGIYNIYSIPAAGGEPKQLTFSKDNSIFVISYFPNDDRILFSSDEGGDEVSHIYLMDENGNIKDLTPGKNVKSDFFDFSPGHSSFYYLSNKRDERYFDVYEMNLSDFKSKILFKNNKAFILGAISANKRFIAFYETVTYEKSNFYLYDLKAKVLKKLNTDKEIVQFIPVEFSPDDKYLLYLTNANSEFMYLCKMDIETYSSEKVEEYPWDVTNSFISQSGKYRITSINNDGRVEIKITNIISGKTEEFPKFYDGDISTVDISTNDSIILFFVNSSRSPRNIYTYNFATKQLKRLTNTMNTAINENDLIEAKVIRYKSFDGLEIPAIYYQPKNIKKDGTNPALVWVHGGPGDQSRLSYSSFFQYLANHGYAVIAVNNRGSSGYGKTFYCMDNMKHGSVDLWDCVEAKKYLFSTGYIDSSKIGIIGRSYGGYMVLAAQAFKPNEFAVGVDMFGISDWLRTIKSIPISWEAERNSIYTEIGDPVKDEKHLKEISPIHSSDKIRKPLMVLQGLNDPRVLKIESDEIVSAVKRNGIPVEYLVFNDEGHGFLKKENEIKAYESIVMFLDKYLRR